MVQVQCTYREQRPDEWPKWALLWIEVKGHCYPGAKEVKIKADISPVCRWLLRCTFVTRRWVLLIVASVSRALSSSAQIVSLLCSRRKADGPLIKPYQQWKPGPNVNASLIWNIPRCIVPYNGWPRAASPLSNSVHGWPVDTCMSEPGRPDECSCHINTSSLSGMLCYRHIASLRSIWDEGSAAPRRGGCHEGPPRDNTAW